MTERAVWTQDAVTEAGWYWCGTGDPDSVGPCLLWPGDKLRDGVLRTAAQIPDPARLAALEELERAVRGFRDADDAAEREGFAMVVPLTIMGALDRLAAALRTLDASDASGAGESGEGG